MAEIIAKFLVPRTVKYWLILDCGHWYKWTSGQNRPPKVGESLRCPNCEIPKVETPPPQAKILEKCANDLDALAASPAEQEPEQPSCCCYLGAFTRVTTVTGPPTECPVHRQPSAPPVSAEAHSCDEDCINCPRCYQKDGTEMCSKTCPHAVSAEAPTQAPCANCGHTEPHDGPSGEVNDACTHAMCNCAFYTPAPTEKLREAYKRHRQPVSAEAQTLAEQTFHPKCFDCGGDAPVDHSFAVLGAPGGFQCVRCAAKAWHAKLAAQDAKHAALREALDSAATRMLRTANALKSGAGVGHEEVRLREASELARAALRVHAARESDNG